jgi:hypothetical protein
MMISDDCGARLMRAGSRKMMEVAGVTYGVYAVAMSTSKLAKGPVLG